jgi:uncharacterized protein
MFRLRVFALIVLAFCGSTTVWADPNFPVLTGRVVDVADLLSGDDEVILGNRLQMLEEKSGHQVAVAIVPSLEGYDIRDYGVQLFRNWKLGDKTKNDGVLILIAPNERKVSIEVGYGLEGDMTDAISSVIINHDMIPRFKTGNWQGGLALGIDDIEKVIGGQGDQIVRQVQNQSAPDVTDWIPILIFIFIVFIILSNASRGRRVVFIPGGFSSGGYSGGGFGGGGYSGGGGGWSGGGGSSGGGGASGSW